MDGSRRALAGLVVAAVLFASSAGLAGCGSGLDTTDPSSISAGMLNALAESDCKQVLKLYPSASVNEEFPSDGCSNEMGGTRAIGTYRCSATDGLENTATVANVRCVSDRDPDVLWDLVLENATDGWIVTGVAGG